MAVTGVAVIGEVVTGDRFIFYADSISETEKLRKSCFLSYVISLIIFTL